MANETPESDFSIECFQNYTAPEVFVQGLAGMVDQSDVATIIRAQKNMLQRFEKTTEMLTNCNQLSVSRLRDATGEFKKHTQLLLDMKKDLEYIFKKIRAIKTKLSTQYPEAYEAAVAAAQANRKPLDDDEDESKESATLSQSKMVATVSTETLKPTGSKLEKDKTDLSLAESSSSSIHRQESKVDDRNSLVKEKNKFKKTGSSSSETQSASSGDECSTDTG